MGWKHVNPLTSRDRFFHDHSTVPYYVYQKVKSAKLHFMYQFVRIILQLISRFAPSWHFHCNIYVRLYSRSKLLTKQLTSDINFHTACCWWLRIHTNRHEEHEQPPTGADMSKLSSELCRPVAYVVNILVNILNALQGVISQKKVLFKTTAVKTSNPTSMVYFAYHQMRVNILFLKVCYLMALLVSRL
jgi:hypothetical protein